MTENNNRYKDFSLSTGLLLTIILILSILAVYFVGALNRKAMNAINSLERKVSVLQEKTTFLETHFSASKEFDQKLIKSLIREETGKSKIKETK